MAHIHQTTMTPNKLELLTAWLPQQPWYHRSDAAPRLTRVGGFRLDDPEGEVGIECYLVTDDAGATPVTYHVPMSYRGRPLLGADEALIGTSEHGVLGSRWIYDGAHDPVVIGQLLQLLQGKAQPQHQTQSDTPDPTVKVRAAATAVRDLDSVAIVNGANVTTITINAGEPVVLSVLRVLDDKAETWASNTRADVEVQWHAPDAAARRARVVWLD